MKVISKVKLLRPSKCFLKFPRCFNLLLLLFDFKANSKFLFQIEGSSVAIIPSSPWKTICKKARSAEFLNIKGKKNRKVIQNGMEMNRYFSSITFSH